MKELTDKQREIFTFIKDSIMDTGFPPTVREIGDRFEITVKGAYDHIKAVEKKGYIKCSQNKSRAIEILDESDQIISPNMINIPLLGNIAAGSPILAQENIEEYLSFPKHNFRDGSYFALHVRGDSMIDEGIFNGDVVIIKKQETANNNDIVAALLDGEATLKRFKKLKNTVQLIPANPAYSVIETTDVVILGVLAGLFRVMHGRR